eukprot:Skav206729  [mRNA]  locus=scaffold2729:30523:31469:- [translate_table: standard]
MVWLCITAVCITRPVGLSSSSGDVHVTGTSWASKYCTSSKELLVLLPPPKTHIFPLESMTAVWYARSKGFVTI